MRKFIVLSIVLLVLVGFAITSSAQEVVTPPSIEIHKTAGVTAAVPGETIDYTYEAYNSGGVPLFPIIVTDNKAETVTWDGIDPNANSLLDPDETWSFIASYDISLDDPEYLCNIAIVKGWYGEGEEDWVSATSDEVCVHTMGARTIGYWKNHPEDWDDFVFMDESNQSVLLTYFPGNGIEVDGVNPLEMLRVQLLAAELNIACFDDDFDYDRYEEEDIDEVITKVEDFLNTCGSWPTDKKDQRDFRKANADELALKDVLDTFNNMGDEIFE